ncbi:hypothetical protein PspLS_01517 [Pyricularia sp. CBS 133598]|nr:hypothetical protein PspLS_01517 [Pyricularia sp. CBS 133598]
MKQLYAAPAPAALTAWHNPSRKCGLQVGLAGGAAGGGYVEVLQRVVGGRGGVGPQRQRRAAGRKLAVGKRAPAPVRADQLGPGAQDRRVRVHGLHARRHAEPAQARGVGLGGELEVLDARAQRGPAVRLDHVEHDLDGAVADGVQGHLEVGGVGLGDDGAELLPAPDGGGVGGVGGVGLAEGGGAGVDDAVADDLDADDAAVRGGVPAVLCRHGDGDVDLRQVLGLGLGGDDEPVGGDAHAEAAVRLDAAAAHLEDRLPRHLVHGHVDHARVAGSVVGVDGTGHGGHALLEASDGRQVRPDDGEDGGLGQLARAGALVVAGDLAALGVRGGLAAEVGDGGGVEPGVVQVLAVDVDGPGVDVVEHAVVDAVGRHAEHPAAGHDALEVRVLARVPRHLGPDVVEVLTPVQRHLGQRLAHGESVQVPVDAARDHGAAAQVPGLEGRLGLLRRDDGRVAGGADVCDGPILHQHARLELRRLAAVLGGCGGLEDLAVDQEHAAAAAAACGI